jgi:hypothetical protein
MQDKACVGIFLAQRMSFVMEKMKKEIAETELK